MLVNIPTDTLVSNTIRDLDRVRIIFVTNDHNSYAGQSVSILEWAISLEIRPKANLLYSLAGVCRDGGR